MEITIKINFSIQDDADYENLQNSLPYCSQEISFYEISRETNSVLIRVASSDQVENVTNKVNELLNKLKPAIHENMTRTIFDNLSVSPPCKEDVYPILLKNGDVFCHAPGIYSLHRKLRQMFERLETHVRKFASTQKAEEVIYPVSIPIATLVKSNFFSAYPHFANFISTLKEDVDNISEFSKKAASDSKDNKAVTLDFLGHLNVPKNMCRSAGCLHSYPSFENKVFKDNETVCLTMMGRMFRNESRNASGLERLNEYSMRELIYFGSNEYVQSSLALSINWFKEFMISFGIKGVIQSANDPFFADNLATLQYFQRSQQTKLEARFYNPSTTNMISVGSINFHGSHFSKSYNIRFNNGNPIATGCVGFGYERLIFLILAQYGYNEDSWPKALREFFF